MNTLTHPPSNVSTSDLLLITLDALRCYVVMKLYTHPGGCMCKSSETTPPCHSKLWACQWWLAGRWFLLGQVAVASSLWKQNSSSIHGTTATGCLIPTSLSHLKQTHLYTGSIDVLDNENQQNKYQVTRPLGNDQVWVAAIRSFRKHTYLLFSTQPLEWDLRRPF